MTLKAEIRRRIISHPKSLQERKEHQEAYLKARRLAVPARKVYELRGGSYASECKAEKYKI